MNEILLAALAGPAGAAGLWLLVRAHATRAAAVLASLAALVAYPAAAWPLTATSALAAGLATLGLALASAGLRLVAAVALLALATWLAPALGIAAAAATAWILPPSRTSLLAWSAGAIALVALARDAGAWHSRALVLAAIGIVALGGRRSLANASLSPGARRVGLLLIGAAPALALLALPFLFGRVITTLERDAVWPALLYAGLAALAGLAAGAVALGFLVIAMTRSALKQLVVGATLGGLLGLFLLGDSAALTFLPVMLAGAAVSAELLGRRLGLARLASRLREPPASRSATGERR